MLKSLLQLVLLIFLKIYNAICLVTGGVHLKKLVPSGTILQGILGGFSGKVGPVVGASWKGIDYMRSYVIPANPSSAAQIIQRAKFAAIVALARDALSSLLNVYWDPFLSKMSGFNRFVQVNIGTLDGSYELGIASKMALGTLEDVSLITGTYNNGDGETIVTWDEATSGNGALTDSVGLVVYDPTNANLTLFTPVVTRDDESITVTARVGLTATDIIVYLFFYRGTGETFVVSDSVSDVCAAP
jgi:hypothetical protein